MKKYISVNKESMEKLRRIFGKVGKPLCERAVKNALNFESNSELAKKIRFCAIHNYYGVTYVVAKEMECFYTADKDMVMLFPNGAEFRASIETGEAVLYFKNRVIERWPELKFSMIENIKAQAAAL